MDLAFSGEYRDFQNDVRAFLAANLPQDIREKVTRGLRLERDDHQRWQNILSAKGWIAPGWPVEHGGTGWSAVQRYIFDEECGRAGAPGVIPFGTKFVGPVIYTFGSEAQKRHYLPRILNNDDWWCQGYSEPGAGSDLASLQIRAVRDGDHYVVNGTKTWTTLAQWATKMFCLVRTSTEGKKQEGISFLLIDMAQPGIEVKPIVTIDGGREINMVHLTDVKVPVADRIGEENKGWTYAKFLLQHERT
ncbi:MAG: acyl-CoA dehydrogenase family protein, partial [Proteobacteria bacterium]|nr:acyl-CoA dehydrogenase family protein [Pseudomonadota bacterium]